MLCQHKLHPLRCPITAHQPPKGPWRAATQRRLAAIRQADLHRARAVAVEAETRGKRNEREPSTSGGSGEELVFEVPDAIRERNAAFAQRLRSQLILAPLTKGGNLPFRRLCTDFGAEVTMSEMAYSKQLLQGDRIEKARMLKAPSEHLFGFQVATKTISDGIAVSTMAAAAGASFMDINCGCPIYEANRRGLGSVMLRKPRALAKMVHGIVCASPLPVTVKIRLGENDKKIVAPQLVEMLAAAGAAAVTIHGRTAEQRYKRPADWSLITSVAEAQPTMPVIGNGDVLTHYEATARLQETGCHAVMVGRGALVKPWLWQELKEGRELLLTASDRIGVYRQLAAYMREHFGDDAMGRRKAFYFYPFHFAFFFRYRHFPAHIYQEASRTAPLLSTRQDIVDPRLGEELDSLPLVERLLRCESEAAHLAIANALWDASSDAEGMAALEGLAGQSLLGWEEEARKSQGSLRGERERESEG